MVDDPPLGLAGGGVIRPGVHAELDHYVHLSRDARGWMANYEAEERRRTGIGSLKVRYNKVFGYYIEVSKTNLGAVPDNYIRKQTLVNAERYFTEELKHFETQVLEADEKRLELEQQVFDDLRAAVGGGRPAHSGDGGPALPNWTAWRPWRKWRRAMITAARTWTKAAPSPSATAAIR